MGKSALRWIVALSALAATPALASVEGATANARVELLASIRDVPAASSDRQLEAVETPDEAIRPGLRHKSRR